MKRDLRVLAMAGPLLLAISVGGTATAAANRQIMGVFHDLVMYKRDVPQNSPQSIVRLPRIGGHLC
jgi:hypothetical protein